MSSTLETREELNSDLIPIEFDFQSYLSDAHAAVKKRSLDEMERSTGTPEHGPGLGSREE